MTTVAHALDFDTLDDLAFADARGRLNTRSLPTINAQSIGPVIELILLAAMGKLSSPHTAPWLSLEQLAPLGKALETGRMQWVCPRSKRTGLLRTSPLEADNATIWTRFGLAAQQAARAAGFPRRISAQLAAALGEFHSNIYEHAQAPHTGMVVFRAQSNQFEFVVADQGVGVLKSLQGATTYANLRDHGEALRLTLAEGVSRYGPGENRGYGFRPLFIGLANLRGNLRFRSGDHALMIDGQHPSLMTARTAQKPPIPGFLISVVCEISTNSRDANRRPT